MHVFLGMILCCLQYCTKTSERNIIICERVAVSASLIAVPLSVAVCLLTCPQIGFFIHWISETRRVELWMQ